MPLLQTVTADHLATMRLPLRTLALLVRTNRRLRALLEAELRLLVSRAHAGTRAEARRLLVHASRLYCDRGMTSAVSGGGGVLALSVRRGDEDFELVLTIRARHAVPRLDIWTEATAVGAVLDSASDVTLITPSGDARASSAGLASALEAAGLWAL